MTNWEDDLRRQLLSAGKVVRHLAYDEAFWDAWERRMNAASLWEAEPAKNAHPRDGNGAAH
jgi:hypothetical protein